MDFSRRIVLRCGLMALAGSALPSAARASAVLPEGAMRLDRRLERGLGDGNAIVVERQWRVAFEAAGRGMVLRGEQVAVNVDAPPVLAQLAAIEEARDTSGMFPIMLSESGEILDAGRPRDADDIAWAIELAETIIAEAGHGGGSHARYLSAIQAAGSQLLDNMPRDLFFPRNTSWSDRRAVPLPDGSEGEIAVSYHASRSADSPWLECAERIVTTRLGSTSRTSRECWVLSPA